ncbi:MAG: hypothetical protein AB8U93_00625 [Francisella endosymbiont of Hyalomma scupense]
MKSILVVDDEKEGYKFYITDSAEAAEHILNSEKIDLMLLDIMMPIMKVA